MVSLARCSGQIWVSDPNPDLNMGKYSHRERLLLDKDIGVGRKSWPRSWQYTRNGGEREFHVCLVTIREEIQALYLVQALVIFQCI